MGTLGERLRYARELAHLTQAQLAKLIGQAPTSIASLEQRPDQRSTYVVELAEAVGVRPEWLALGREPMTRPPLPAAEDLELARQIGSLPPAHKAAVRALVLAYADSSPRADAPRERVR